MNENNTSQELNEEESFDVKLIFFKIIRYWKIIILSIICCLSIIYVYNKYSIPKYSATAKVLVNSKKEEINPLTTGLNSSVNLPNEIQILQSYDFARIATHQMDWQVSYFRYGRLREIAMSGYSPFTISIDSNHLQSVGLKYEITVLSSEKFKLKIAPTGNLSLYDFSKEKFSTLNKTLPNGFEKDFSFGEKITTDFFSFTVNNVIGTFNDPEYYFVLNSLEMAVANNRDYYASELGGGTNVLVIYTEDKNRNNAIKRVNALAETYINHNLEEKNKQAKNAILFIDEQLHDISDSLKKSESQLENYRKSNKMLAVGDISGPVFSKMYSLDDAKAQLELQSKYFEYVKSYINKSLANKTNIIAPSLAGIENGSISTLIEQLNELYFQRKELAITSTAENPSFQQIETKIKNVENTLLENLRSTAVNNKITKDDIDQQLAIAKEEVSKLPEREREFVNINRQYKVNEGIYSMLLNKRVESGITLAGTTSDCSIIDIARRATKIYPKNNINYIIGFIIGFLLPIGFIFLKDFLNDKVQTKKDIESIVRIPIIGSIGHYSFPGNTVVLDKPKSIIAETYRSLRTNLQFMAYDVESKIISITSTFSGEGKTFNSINIASIFSISNKKTILLGCDLRKPKIFDDFGLSNENGITSYLIGKSTLEDIIQKTDYPNFDIISSGPIPPNPSELLETNKFDILLEELKKIYDNIIIDTPPIGLVTDAVFLMKRSDISLYVVRQNYTPKSALKILKELKEVNNIKNLSVVINDVKNDSEHGYGYGYGYGNYYQEDEAPKKLTWIQRLFKI